ncbi:MAG: InlB B-repeat-containing protein, partial [Deltaproteobacteria bacterium]
MKRIPFCFSALICLLLVAGCGKNGEKKTPPAPAIKQYTLTYTAGPNGTIKGAGTQIVKHGGDGSPVTAVAAEHYHFAGWSDGVTTPQRTDRKVTADLKVRAEFAIDQYTLTYAAGDHGTIEGAGTQKVDYGADGSEVTAKPTTGYHFVEWSDGVTTARRTDSDVTADL